MRKTLEAASKAPGEQSTISGTSKPLHCIAVATVAQPGETKQPEWFQNFAPTAASRFSERQVFRLVGTPHSCRAGIGQRCSVPPTAVTNSQSTR